MTDSYLVSHTVEWNWTVSEHCPAHVVGMEWIVMINICSVFVMLNVHVFFITSLVSRCLYSHRGNCV